MLHKNTPTSSNVASSSADAGSFRQSSQSTQCRHDSHHGEESGQVQSQFERVLANAPVAYFLHDANNIVRTMNRRAMDLFGIDTFDGSTELSTLISDPSVDLLQYHLRRLASQDVAAPRDTSSVEIALQGREDGQTVVLAETSILDSGLYQTVMVDVTTQKQAERERAQFEDKIRQSQKLEILYQLSGGIAHDFNNLLQVLEIQSDLALSLSRDDNREGKQAIRQISESVRRGTLLTKRLLAFSRQAPLTKERIDLNSIVQNSMSIVGPAIGQTLNVSIKPSHEPLGVWVDPVQIEQLLMNLCLNARDATGHHGELTIETCMVEQLTPAMKSGLELFVGPYAKILATDNGSGISESIRNRMFEAFSTTKDAGKGTGLGLAIVHNILKQHEGAIEVVESSATGTKLAIYLPMFHLKNVTTDDQRDNNCLADSISDRFKVALVADDEAAIRAAMTHALEANDVNVLSASDGAEAIQLMDEHPEIQLVLSDVVMPAKGGLEVCEHYRKTNSSGAVVLMSGHGDSVLDQDYLFRFNANFLQKPFSVSDLQRLLMGDFHMAANRHSPPAEAER